MPALPLSSSPRATVKLVVAYCLSNGTLIRAQLVRSTMSLHGKTVPILLFTSVLHSFSRVAAHTPSPAITKRKRLEFTAANVGMDLVCPDESIRR